MIETPSPTPVTSDDPLLSTSQIAAYLAVPVSVIRRAIREDALGHGVRVGSRMFWRRSVVDAWANGTTDPSTTA